MASLLSRVRRLRQSGADRSGTAPHLSSSTPTPELDRTSSPVHGQALDLTSGPAPGGTSGPAHGRELGDTSAHHRVDGADDAELDALRGELVRELDRLATPERGG